MACTSLSPCRTVVTSFSPRSTAAASDDHYDEGVWVLYVEACPASKWLSCALSNGDVPVYDQERLHLLHVYQKTHGDAIITDLSCAGPNLLATSAKDGGVCLYDVRQPSPALRFALARSEEALSVSVGYGGALAAVGGGKAHVHFHDLRNAGAVLGSYRDAHTEEVNRVRFQPQNDFSTTSLLVSASEDGLSCIFDTSQPSEEAALRSVFNVQSPLRQVGFFGPSYEGVYCLTGSETMSVWHHDSAQRICDFGMDVRGKLSHVAGGMSVDYLVDCHWDSRRGQLSLLAGNHAGDAAVFQVDAGVLSLSHILSGGHRGVVRSWSQLSANLFVTGGEDARLCEWNRMGRTAHDVKICNRKDNAQTSPQCSSELAFPPPPTRGGGPLRRLKSKNKSSTPY